MSDCICGARGIDLQGHECIPSLRDLVVFHARANLELKREIQNLQALIDRLQFDLAETQKREKRLEQNLGLCMAEFNRANDALDKIMQDSFKGSGR